MRPDFSRAQIAVVTRLFLYTGAVAMSETRHGSGECPVVSRIRMSYGAEAGPMVQTQEERGSGFKTEGRGKANG